MEQAKKNINGDRERSGLTQRTQQSYDANKELTLPIVQVLLESSMPRMQQIKIRARGLCPKCHKPFTSTAIGFICLEHLTTPKRYLLDFWREITVPGRKKPTGKERVRIYSDKEGKLLESYTDALELKSIIEEELRNKTFDPEKYARQKKSLFQCSTLFPKFLAEKLKTCAPSEEDHWKQHIKIISDYFKDSDVREIASKKVYLKDFISYLQETYVDTKQWKAKTMKNCAHKMRHFLNWVHDDLEMISRVPAFPDIETDAPIHTWLQSDDQLKIFDVVNDKDKPFIGFLFLHGLRPGEGRALKCKDIDIETKTITVHATFSKETYRSRRKGKKAKPLYIPIHPEAFEYLNARKLEALPEAWVFPNPRTGDHYKASNLTKLWDRIRTKLKITTIRLYDASRHSYASQLVAAGVSIYKVKDLLGHTSVKTTETNYAHVDLESLRAEISKVTLQKKVVSLKRVSEKTVSDVSLEKTDS